MSTRRGTSLFIRAAILFLLICLGVLFLAASIMSRKYAEGPDQSSIKQAQPVVVATLWR